MIIYVLIIYAMIRQVSAATEIKIMPLGGLLTKGNTEVDGAYRTGLYQSLKKLGYDIDLVGNEMSEITNKLPDADHEGHDWLISQFTLYVEELLETTQPDIILVMVGGKDISEKNDDAVNDLDVFITKIVSLRPSVRLFVSNLPMRKNNGQNNRVETLFNPAVKEIVQNHAKQGENISFVDTHSVITINQMDTNVYPTKAGFNIIGDTFAQAIVSSSIKPDGTGLPNRAIIKARGLLDRNKVIVSFSQYFPEKKVEISNFSINNGIEILNVSRRGRNVIIDTTEQSLGERYRVTVQSGAKGGNQIDFFPGWRMLVMPDWHLGEKYVFDTKPDEVTNDIKIINYLKRDYGGELVLIPGDTNAGFWSTESFRQEMSDHVGYAVSENDAVLMAGERCYKGLLNSFRHGGYWNVLVAFGDHEGGDNPWKRNSMKSILQPEFRKTFSDNINYDFNGNFLYSKDIGNLSSIPFGTIFEGTSHAYINRNTLIVTINVLDQQSPKKDIGETGTVTGRVSGAHLDWFDSILREGRRNNVVKHIFVQGHFPVLFPVRKVQSSGMYIDDHDNSPFLKVMRTHKVDIYFAGEAHLNTVTKDYESELVQVVSRGNYFSNFLTVDVSNDSLYIKSHNEMGEEKTMYNYNHEESGELSIKKEEDNSQMNSSGELQFLDRSLATMHFTFEKLYSLEERPVLGLSELPGVRRAPIVSEVTVAWIACHSSLPNIGGFGQNYDAQVANIDLVPGVYGKAGAFDFNSRAAVLGMGPHSGGKAVSYSLWLKTTTTGQKVVISYEGYWRKQNIMNLRLRNGRPELSYSKTQQVRVSEIKLNDDKWHHISVVMPKDDCLLSEILFYIDGTVFQTELFGDDSVINVPNGGMISIGGFGHGNVGSEEEDREGFMGGSPFVGYIDDVFVWARTLDPNEVKNLATRSEPFALRSKLSYRTNEALCIGLGLMLNQVVLTKCNDQPSQQWVVDSLGYIHNRSFYQKCLIPQSASSSVGTAVQMGDCNLSDNHIFKWNLGANGLLEYSTNSELYLTVNENKDNMLELRPTMESEIQNWDIVYDGMYPASYLTAFPSAMPSNSPSEMPSKKPSSVPSLHPSLQPTEKPSSFPSEAPTAHPTSSPTAPPTARPTLFPSASPTARPTLSPSASPTLSPSVSPTARPTLSPSVSPSKRPSERPSLSPSSKPSQSPSWNPTKSSIPSTRPTMCEEQKDDPFGKFPLPNGRTKSCRQVKASPNLCKYPNISNNCPITCGLDCLNLDCQDHSGEFVNPIGQTSYCSDAIKSPNLCVYPYFQEKCQVSCFRSCDKCADLVLEFESPTKSMKSCSDAGNNANLCTKSWFQSRCPVTCDTCDSDGGGDDGDDGGDDGGGDGGGDGEPPISETCEDSDLGFENSKGKTKHCSDLKENPSLCNKTLFRKNCKKTCLGTCDDCVDADGVMISGKYRTCERATTPSHSLCKKNKFKKACPKACAQC